MHGWRSGLSSRRSLLRRVLLVQTSHGTTLCVMYKLLFWVWVVFVSVPCMFVHSPGYYFIYPICQVRALSLEKRNNQAYVEVDTVFSQQGIDLIISSELFTIIIHKYSLISDHIVHKLMLSIITNQSNSITNPLWSAIVILNMSYLLLSLNVTR